MFAFLNQRSRLEVEKGNCYETVNHTDNPPRRRRRPQRPIVSPNPLACWTDNDGKAPGEHYDWKCQVSVPGGGILQSTNELDYQAPLYGYQAADVIDMPARLETDWSSHASRNYFLKLANGNYARISFEMVAGGDHFFQLETFLNPSGSRSLEFDPQIAINP